MNIVSSDDWRAPLPVEHLALGFFDGLHLGHRSVVQWGAKARYQGVLTFEPHPLALLAPQLKPLLITGKEHKNHVLTQWGVTHLLQVRFDAQRAQQKAEEFLSDIAQWCPKLQSVSAGYNWKFGQDRGGNIQTLKTWCEERGLECYEVEPVLYQQEPISSTRIRESIITGEIESASAMLGRPFALFGTVIHGDALGKTLGFPTANLQTLDECLPPSGVYAGYAHWLEAQERHACAINIGVRPTVQSSTPTLRIEAHLLDFEQNLYGQTLMVEFHDKIRDEQRFVSLGALKEQLGRDVQCVRSVLGEVR